LNSDESIIGAIQSITDVSCEAESGEPSQCSQLTVDPQELSIGVHTARVLSAVSGNSLLSSVDIYVLSEPVSQAPDYADEDKDGIALALDRSPLSAISFVLAMNRAWHWVDTQRRTGAARIFSKHQI